ncbi:GNAT family N-acetyltransferase [uncultured Jannaschia sp.]|uniref:GNAT family N-acetyltransferase n=1 Tax=uncultured Jannaschia sp. TaxID=293347 RepID=UPI002629AC2E|nr:GNAT family N-acetyltransferase [uncultured Jannaschia sp.]
MLPELVPTLTRDPSEVAAAHALRRACFVDELGAEAEADAFDDAADHLVLRDRAQPQLGVVATLRIAEGTDYTAREFDLSRLRASGRSVAEAGRACVHRDYRNGIAGLVLFTALLRRMRARGVGYLVGTASFGGADPGAHMPALCRLRMEASAPRAIAPVARGPGAVAIRGEAPRSAMRHVPSLIKTYLRAGAVVGDGAYVDRAFNTVDVCMVLEPARARLPDALLRDIAAIAR